MSGPGVEQTINSRAWHTLVNVLAASQAVSPLTRTRVLRRCGIDTVTTDIQSGCFFFSAGVRIGARTLINHRCYFDSRAPITIGDACSLAPEVMMCTSGHHLGGAAKRAGSYRADPIVVGDGTWIGARAVVLGGVTIGTGCMIAAGAVVAADCTADGLYAGVPARRVKDL